MVFFAPPAGPLREKRAGGGSLPPKKGRVRVEGGCNINHCSFRLFEERKGGGKDLSPLSQGHLPSLLFPSSPTSYVGTYHSKKKVQQGDASPMFPKKASSFSLHLPLSLGCESEGISHTHCHRWRRTGQTIFGRRRRGQDLLHFCPGRLLVLG